MPETQHTKSCPSCGHSNPGDARMCVECGARLEPSENISEDTRARIDAPRGRQALRAVQTTSPPIGADTDPPVSKKRAPASAHVTQPPVTNRPAPPAVKDIPEGCKRLSLGYNEDNDLVIPRANISGHHAVLAYSPATRQYYLKDLESTNGSSVNDHMIRCAIIHPGDQINLGSYSFVFDKELIKKLDALPAPATASSSQLTPARRLVLTIGRDPSCDIMLDALQISRKHVRLSKTAGGWLVEDLSSANGVFLNDRNASPITKVEATERDVIYMGSYRFPLSRIKDFIVPKEASRATGAMAMPANKKIITIGRGTENDIVLDAPQVSRHHARIVRKDGKAFVEDLASANGTFVNGKRVGRSELTSADTISFGTYAVRIDLERGALQKSYRGDIVLQAENIRVDVKDADGGNKRLLDGVSFTAYPTEFIGLMGPSGAGKTTLLMAMIGYIRPTYGRTLINGDELSTHYDRYRGAIGYVPQEDIIHGELTVYEALYYTAKLRLPRDTDDAEIQRRIEEVLTNLEISQTAHVRIGSPEQKGISGGQRKRVNLALELLTEPSLLCLDEPTSGLASEDAANVMRLLRKLSDEGRTILLTIHQPSLQVYRQLDNVIYLADGEHVYYGPTYPDSILYFHPHVRQDSPLAQDLLADPGSCLKPLVDAKRAGEPMETFAARYRQSDYFEEYVEQRRRDLSDVNITGSSEKRAPEFSFHQLIVLSKRYLAIKLKDRVGTTILMAQAPIIAIFVSMVFSGQDVGVLHRMEYMPFALFLLVISSIWFGCSNAAREIVSEQAIYTRERMVNLSIPAYVGSKFLVQAGLTLAQCITLLIITYAMLDMVGNPLIHLGVLWACALAATGMGLTLSALVRTTPAALALVPLLLIPQVILGGAIMPLDRMKDPGWTLSNVMLSRWGYEGMLQTEHLADAYELSASDLPKPIAPGLPAPPPPPNPIDRFIGDAETGLVAILLTLTVFTVVLLLSTAAALRLRERR